MGFMLSLANCKQYYILQSKLRFGENICGQFFLIQFLAEPNSVATGYFRVLHFKKILAGAILGVYLRERERETETETETDCLPACLPACLCVLIMNKRLSLKTRVL